VQYSSNQMTLPANGATLDAHVFDLPPGNWLLIAKGWATGTVEGAAGSGFQQAQCTMDRYPSVIPIGTPQRLDTARLSVNGPYVVGSFTMTSTLVVAAESVGNVHLYCSVTVNDAGSASMLFRDVRITAIQSGSVQLP
jgi:hypothetical protein